MVQKFKGILRIEFPPYVPWHKHATTSRFSHSSTGVLPNLKVLNLPAIILQPFPDIG